MEFVKIEAKPRTEHGKSTSARLRREGLIPATAYGRGTDARSLTVSPKELASILASPFGRNSVVEIKVGTDEPFNALICDYSYHPVTRALIHADFLRIDLDQPVDVDVPLVLTGKAEGVVAGGILRQVFRRLPIRCVPRAIPLQVEHDVTALAQGDTFKVSELKLPEGVSVRMPPELTLGAVYAPEAVVEEVVPGAVPAEGAAAPAAAAPAAAPEKKK